MKTNRFNMRNRLKAVISIYLFLSMLLSHTLLHGQNGARPETAFDTTGIVIRVYRGDLPGQKRDPSIDYALQLCAYTFNNGKLQSYSINHFDLIYLDQAIDSTITISGQGNLFNPAMQVLIYKSDGKPGKLYLDNIAIENNQGEKLVIRGLRPLIN